MKTECENFENTFSCENADEAHVEVLQGEDPHLGLTIVVQGHCQHVQADEDHDDHVKLLVGYNPEHDCLWTPLKKDMNIDYDFILNYFHKISKLVNSKFKAMKIQGFIGRSRPRMMINNLHFVFCALNGKNNKIKFS